MSTQVIVQYPLQKTFLAILVKTHPKGDIKVFWSCQILIDVFTFCKIFCHRLPV